MTPGTRLGAYDILGLLGAGGMGEVYRATDTRLGRQVAIKVLPADVAHDPERLARFEREARLLASLNHPNIAAIHGLEYAEGVPFLALELVEGEDLAERLRRGAMSSAEALPIARQIASALEAAHANGVIHRDLKPANVKVTPDGTVKVLDFGLAKAWANDRAAASDRSQSPTLLHAGTAAGLILGTAAYMSPEQARGRVVDKRTDIWSFGAVLFELLTAERAFGGETLTDVLAAVVQTEPAWDRLPASVPASIRRLLRRCLAKSADDRLHDIADARLEIAEAIQKPAAESPLGPQASGPPVTGRPNRRKAVVLAVMLAAAAAAGVVTGRGLPMRAAVEGAEPVRRLSITGLTWTDAEVAEAAQIQNLVALSPDGSRLVYAGVRDGTRRLYLRPLDAFEANPIKGTENGYGPFFSPDGGSIAFAADGKLKRVALDGGFPQAFGTTPSFRGGSWRADGSVFYSPVEGAGLWKTSISGGPAEELEAPDAAAGEVGRGLTAALPGSEWILFTATMGGRASRVRVYSMTTRRSRILLEDANNACFLPPNHLVFGRGDEIWAIVFDPLTATVAGTPRRIVDRVWAGSFVFSTFFALSANGVLVYAPAGSTFGRRSLVWVDREGRETAITREARAYAAPRLSPDGRSILVRMAEETTDIWRFEIERGVLTRLTSDPFVEAPLWSADGKELVYVSNRSGMPAIYRRSIAGEGEPVPVGRSQYGRYSESLSMDGKTVVAMEMNPKSGPDLYLIPLAGGAPAVPLLVTASSEYAADLSPDGKWFVYTSRASGRTEVFARSIAAGGDARQVSLDGGTEPRWSRAGDEIFYRSGQRMMAAQVKTNPVLEVSPPRTLFSGPYEVMDGPINYDVTTDGRRFLMVKMEASEAPAELRVVTGWARDVEKVLPTGR